MCRFPLILAALLFTSAACGDAASEDTTPAVPDDHPCPEVALPPSTSDLWLDATPTEPVPLALVVPLASGGGADVTQGNDELPTHLGTLAWAWDFGVAEGTDVLAAAPGVVVWVRDDSTTHGQSVDNVDDANWLVVDHGGGLYSSYVHLAAASSLVAPGDVVAAGDTLANTGLSGLLGAAHLHFQVENVWSTTLPATFVEAEAPFTCMRRPARDEAVARPANVASTLVGTTQVSDIPADAFAEAGVTAVSGLPGRLMSRSEVYDITGAADPSFDTVWLLVFPDEGGDAALALDMPLDPDGAFGGKLTLDDLDPGRYGWAMAAAHGADVFAPAAIRLSVID